MISKYITGPWDRLIRQPSFVICTVLLITCAGLRAGAKWLQQKEAVDLYKPLSQLDRDALGPYVFDKEIPIMPEVESELGTSKYINWILKDTSVSEGDPAQYLGLFVSYYTGTPDKVAHIPEICRVANGWQIDNDENTEITAPDCGLESNNNKLPIRILDAELPQFNTRSQKQTIAYFFAVNGGYCCTRNQVRNRMNNWRNRYAFYSKIEITPLAGPDTLPREQALAAVAKLCRTVTPILWSEHWPDWESLPQR